MSRNITGLHKNMNDFQKVCQLITDLLVDLKGHPLADSDGTLNRAKNCFCQFVNARVC
jgi:hypothetical protein